MIPVRVPAGLRPVLAHDRVFSIGFGHPAAEDICPACGEKVFGRSAVLVFVGIPAEDRKNAGWTTGGAVLVHQACAL